MRFPKRTVVAMLSVGLLLVMVAVFGGLAAPAQAADNDGCLACHGQSGMLTTLPSGEKLYLTVDPQVYNSSVHGQKGQACLDCHPDVDTRGSPQGRGCLVGAGGCDPARSEPQAVSSCLRAVPPEGV